mmetsp:Transcript_96387/g.152437  ORF Transcript_96387/g.152437 Transcript_96387/m.152437 type:complete len:220 (-) Transcript_96387:43-702(-)
MAYLSFNDALTSNVKIEDDADAKEAMPLAYKWKLWEQVADSKYSDALHEVAEFSSAQEFWGIFNKVPQPSILLENKRMVRLQKDGSNATIDSVCFFRDGIRPEWEDEVNKKGGHFQFQLKTQSFTSNPGQLDEYWNNLVLGMIGATLSPAQMVTGIRLVDKVGGPRAAGVVRIEVWFSNYSDTQAVDALFKSVEACMTKRFDGSAASAAPKSETKPHSR